MDNFTNGFYSIYEKLCEEKHASPTGTAISLGLSRGTVNRWKNGSVPDGETLKTLSKHFNVSVDYLLGNTEIKNTPYRQSPKEIAQVALFGGDTDVTEEMWDEVKDFVEYVKAKHKKDN